MRIVYYDGGCGVCNRFIDYLLKHQRSTDLRYAALQGSTARERLPADLVQDMSTMVFEESDGTIHTRSTAAIKSLAATGGVLSVMSVFLLVPKFIRDGFYSWFADHRSWFKGKRRERTSEEVALILP